MRTYYDRDTDIALIRGKTVAIVGYGNQGRAHALNLRDSGVTVIVGGRPGSTLQKAEAEGLKVMAVAEAAQLADAMLMSAPDELQGAIYDADIAPHLKKGGALVFAHGFSIHFKTIEPRADLDIILVAPEGPGHQLRSEYERGFGLLCLLAVQQDATGQAKALGLSYASALGCGRSGIMESTFKDECETDLFGEQVVLCGGQAALIRAAYETLVEAGYTPEMAYFECLHQVKLLADLSYERGIGRDEARARRHPVGQVRARMDGREQGRSAEAEGDAGRRRRASHRRRRPAPARHDAVVEEGQAMKTMPFLRAAVAAIAAAATAPASAHRSYVPPECRAVLDAAAARSIYNPTSYRDCMLRAMGVQPAESRLAKGETAFRVLAEIGGLATPVFVEFVRSALGVVTLDVRAPTPEHPRFIRAIGERQWRAIETRWVNDTDERNRIAAPRDTRDSAPRAEGTAEIICIPSGGADLEVVAGGVVTRRRADGCNEPMMAFPGFLLAQAVAAAGACTRVNSPLPYANDTTRLLSCLGMK